MKILQLTIKNQFNEEIKTIEFNETGISYVFANINEPKNRRKTINSVGKTLLLKFVYFIFGANDDKKSQKN